MEQLIRYESPRLEKFISDWTKNIDESLNFQDFLKLVGINLPVYLRDFDRNNFKCDDVLITLITGDGVDCGDEIIINSTQNLWHYKCYFCKETKEPSVFCIFKHVTKGAKTLAVKRTTFSYEAAVFCKHSRNKILQFEFYELDSNSPLLPDDMSKLEDFLLDTSDEKNAVKSILQILNISEETNKKPKISFKFYK